ncbi:HAD family hydrolase [Sorangium sp. So ce1667]
MSTARCSTARQRCARSSRASTRPSRPSSPGRRGSSSSAACWSSTRTATATSRRSTRASSGSSGCPSPSPRASTRTSGTPTPRWRRRSPARARPSLRARGRRLGVVTNGRVRVQEAKLRALDVLPYLDVALISEREQLRKPDPAIFLRAVERLGLRAGQACYVGDHPAKDVLGARDAGLHAVWLRTPHFPAPESAHTAIDDLSELLALV